MTECERFIEEGEFDEAFFQEEIRNGYKVKSKIKKVWAVELDLLKRLDSLCRKYKLRYWVAFGTLLGAVRHEGFIPWDDDLDVWLPREDYEKLLKIPANEIEPPYFLQTTLNDQDYYSAFARFRNSNTTGILVSKNNKCNNGIYIDIYPIDGVSSKKIVRIFIRRWIKIQNIIAHAYMFNINPHPLTRCISKILRSAVFPYDPKKNYQRINRLSARKTWDDADKVDIVTFPLYQLDNGFLKSDFSKTEYLPFEGMLVPVPGGYANILTNMYGDFMKFPPEEDRGVWHDFIFEPDIPYKEYMQKHKEHI